jgi:hypothetical protein
MSPIEMTKDSDGVYVVKYFGALVGWIRPSTYLTGGRRKCFRALSVHSDLMHLHSLKSARDWLMSNYH